MLENPQWTREELYDFVNRLQGANINLSQIELRNYCQTATFYGLYLDEKDEPNLKPLIREHVFLELKNSSDDGVDILSSEYSDFRWEFERAFRYYEPELYQIAYAYTEHLRIFQIHEKIQFTQKLKLTDNYRNWTKEEKLIALNSENVCCGILDLAICDSSSISIAVAALCHKNISFDLIKKASVSSVSEYVRQYALDILYTKENSNKVN